MIKPELKGEAFLSDVARKRQDRHTLHLWWLGQSGFLIAWQGACLLTDPYLSDSLTIKYANTDQPHVRITERVIEPERLDFIDVTTSSHNHTDHLDKATLLPLLTANPAMTLIVPTANRGSAAERLGLAPERLTPASVGMKVEAAGFSFHALPSAHTALDRDEQGQDRYVGYIIQAGPWVLYHSGDTVLYDGMQDRLRQWSIDLALLPINGNRPERRVAGNLDGQEAATLAKNIRARLAIPCHYDMFAFNTESPDLFVATAQLLGQAYTVLQNGGYWSSSQLEQA